MVRHGNDCHEGSFHYTQSPLETGGTATIQAVQGSTELGWAGREKETAGWHLHCGFQGEMEEAR